MTEKQLTEKHSAIIELLRYPVLVLSIVVALVILKYVLGLQFGVVTEISTQGVKMAAQSRATLESLAALEARVNDSHVRIQAIEEKLNAPIMEAKQVESRAFSAAQMVSDTTAKIARLQAANTKADIAPTRGYIWIGNYNGKWEPSKIARLDTGQPIALKPEQIYPNTEYKILGNMVLRDGMPANDKEYYSGRTSLGVVPSGSRIIIRKLPVGVDREFAVQYWAEIEVITETKGK